MKLKLKAKHRGREYKNKMKKKTQKKIRTKNKWIKKCAIRPEINDLSPLAALR